MVRFFKRRILLFIVFLTGACVLIIEVVATRILSPYFGNTIFTFSSVISVILAALSIGYYYGGRLSDKYPSEKVFFGIIFISGLSIFVLQILSLTFLPLVGYNLSFVWGPLISSLTLFLIPGILLGSLSPYAIRLQRARLPKEGIGTLTGEIFFYSTFGSIVGSLLAGFFLIPYFGIDRIILGCAVFLTVLGVIPIMKDLSFKKLFLIIFLPLFFYGGVIFCLTFLKQELVYERDGIYERIKIYDEKYQGKDARFMMLDRSSSGAGFRDSSDLVYDYPKYYELYKLFRPSLSRALVIGGGAYSLPMKILTENDQVIVDVSEIEPTLYELSKRYFWAKDSDRLFNFIVDGRRFLVESDKKYDLIFSDVNQSLYSAPVHFTTIEFFRLVLARLSNEGVFIANLPGALDPTFAPFLFAEVKTARMVFPKSYLLATRSLKADEPQNIMFVGYNGKKDIDLRNIKSSDKKIQSLLKYFVDMDVYDFEDFPILTDNYSPVEYFAGKFLSNMGR